MAGTKNSFWRFACALPLIAAALVLSPELRARTNARFEPRIPDIPGYVTLKCDLHTHTVFSDGRVWPDIRIEEAWRDGLDAIAISDHIEYTPHDEDVRRDHDRSFEVASPMADQLGIILIKAVEITKQVPPGHFNALFLDHAARVEHEDYLESIGRAVDQGAFVFWNHPPFKQKDNRSIWHPEHTKLLEKGWLHGIEVVNGSDYYPKAQQWCLEKGLTFLGTSDVHSLIDFDYDPRALPGDFRPMTLVFAEEKTQEALKQALFARRTAVFAKGKIYGESIYLRPIFESAVELVTRQVTVAGKGLAVVQVHNRSDIPFMLVADGELAELKFPNELELVPGGTVRFNVSGKSAETEGTRQVLLPWRATNLVPAPGQSQPVQLELTVTFTKPAGKDR
ncbi:MAG: histidinol-phosphatase [Candidatus Glassbacteria bacterium]|nr:histidinol-phosphatase [Candidatus Glassbacteria bacterium]